MTGAKSYKSGTIGICLIGAGRMGCRHAANVAASARADLVYVVDPNKKHAESVAAQFGSTAVGLKAALDDAAVHGVMIASTTDTHAELIEAASRAGKAVFCEKPVDMDIERTQRVLAIERDYKTAALIGFNRRFDESYQAVHHAARSGKIGQVELVSITSRDWPVPSLEYLRTSGGMFRDMTIHDFDMARWLLGDEPSAVFAAGSALVDQSIEEIGDIDTAAIVLKTKRGAMSQITNSRRAVYGYDQRIEVFGSQGMVRADNRHPSSAQLYDSKGLCMGRIYESFPDRYSAAYVNELEHFLDCIAGKAKPMVGVEDGLRAMILAEAAERSLRSGQWEQVSAV